jgi:aminoglycoside phosphotransferase (APT) family kinase protein
VQRFFLGRPGEEDDSSTPWSFLGSYGRAIHDIQPDDAAPDSLFTRFGRDLQQAWADHLAYNVERLDRADPLFRAGVYSRGRQLQLVESLHDLASVPLRFGLSHGDLTTRNLLVSDTGPPVLIDWGSAAFGPVPWTDLLILDRVDLVRETTPMRSGTR